MKLSVFAQRAKPTFLVLAFLLIASACTHVYDAPEGTVTSYEPSATKIPLNVGLVLTDEFKASKWERSSMGDTFVMPIGENLARNSEALAKQTFSNVTVAKSQNGFSTANVSAILTPRLAALDQNQAAWAFGKSTLVVILEWEMRTPDGDLIWVDSVKGEGKNSGGNSFTHAGQAEERIEQAVDMLFASSYQTISKSKEIKRFAGR